MVADIRLNLTGKKTKFKYILREGNQQEYYLENLEIDKGNYKCLHFHNIETTRRKIINSGKLK